MNARLAAVGLQAIVFDFDGVIADSMGVQEQAWRAVTEDDPELQRQIVANLYAGRAGEGMFAETTLTEDRRRELRHAKDDLWHTTREAITLMPGAASVIPRLAQRFPIGIATSADRPYAEAVLQSAGILSHFGVLVTNADVPNPKPAPDMLVTAASQLGAEVRRVLMIGDTDADRQLAANAGTKFLRFGPARPDEPEVDSVASWAELETLLLGE